MAGTDSQMQHQAASDSRHLMSLLGGGAALAWGLQRRDLTGLLAGAAGGMLLYYGIRGGGTGATEKSVDIKTAVSIDRSPEELYNFWHGFTRLPQFMRYLEEVSPSGPNRTRWVARAPVGPSIEWESEVIADEPNKRIAWRSVEGSQLMNDGEVRFIPPASSRDLGTMVEVAMRFQPPAGPIGSAIGQLLSGMTRQAMDADLRRFKQLMESGEASAQSSVAE